jgi:hypothetical protein
MTTDPQRPGESQEQYQARLDREQDAARRAERRAANQRYVASREGQQLTRYVTATDSEYTYGHGGVE